MAENNNNSFIAKSVKVELTTDLTKYEQGIAKAEKELSKFTKAVEENKKKQNELQKKIDESIKTKGEDSNETKKLTKELEKLKEKEATLNKQIDDVNSSIKTQAKEMLDSAKSTEKMSKGFSGVKTAALAVKAALLSMTAVKLKEWLIDSNSQWEIYEANLSTILQSTAKANNLLNSLTDFASKTPFEISGLVEASEQLLAYGVSLNDLELRLQQLGDLSKGQEDIFERITAAYGKMNAKGKVSLEELNMLTEAGVPILNELANVLNTDSSNLFTLISNGAVSINEINEAFTNLTSEGGQFYGLMEKQSQTLNGMVSNLGDFVSSLGRNLGEEAFVEIKDALSDLLDELDRMEKTGELGEIVRELGDGIADITKFIIELIKLLYEYKKVIELAIVAWGGYTVAIKAAGVAQKLYKDYTIMTTTAITAQEAATKAATIASYKLNAALAAAAVAITLVVAEVNKANEEWDSYREGADEVLNSNKDLIKGWNSETESIERNKIKVEEYLKQIKELGETEEEFKRNKKEITSLIEKVNKIYPELELGINAEGTALNKTNQELEEYIRLKEQELRASAASKTLEGLYESQYDTYAQAKIMVARLKELRKEADELSSQKGFRNIFTEQGQRYQEVANEILALEEALGEMEDQSNITASVIKSLEVELSAVSFTTEEATDEAEDYASKLDLINDSVNTVKTSINKLAETTDYFNGIIKQNETELGLSKSQILDLIDKYPEIYDKIIETSDGYKIEQGVLEDLKEIKETQMREAINAEIAMTEQTMLSTNDRLTAIQKEISGIGSLAEAKAKLAELEGKKKEAMAEPVVLVGGKSANTNLGNKSLRETPITNGSGGRNKSEWHPDVAPIEKDIEAVKESIKLYEELDTSIAEIEALKTSLNISTSDKGTNTTTGGNVGGGETAAEIELRNLKYSYNMGLISAEEYYKSLAVYRDKYYKTDSKERQQFNLEIKNGWDRLNDELYNSSKKSIESKISDGEFYGTISYEDYKEYYGELRKIADEAYKKGILDEQEYADEVNKINRDLYSAKKDYIEDYYKTQKEAVSKAYETARNEINQYYDEIERREKQAEFDEELADLDSEISKYQNAKTGAGIEKLNSLKEQREELIKEMARTERDYEKASSLEALEEMYSNWQTAQEEVFNNVSTYAEDTTTILIELSRRVNQTIAEMNAMANSGYQTINNTKNVNVNLTNNNNLQTQSDFEVLMRQNSSSIAYGLQF